MTEFGFEELPDAPLLIDAVYKSGPDKNIKAEPLTRLFPKLANVGGFRKSLRADGSGLPGFVVIVTSDKEPEWPDYLDVENGIFRYYGDNRSAGKDIHDTQKKGNELLRDVFQWLGEGGESLKKIPPFFIFRRTGTRFDTQFLGLAVPGNNNIPPDRDLIAFWRTLGGKRFQNYEAYFTILDTKSEGISREWIHSLVNNPAESLQYAPSAWKSFVEKGRNGIKALTAPKIQEIPSKADQLPDDKEGKLVLQMIREFYREFPQGFEKCATKLVQMMDANFYRFDITRPWRDGGRDAVGKYHIGLPDHPLTIDCALEAKCYAEGNSVGVREMSRLISRIKYRQFGILVTTSYVDKQAYSEIIEDGHPVLIVNARDIASILRKNGIGSQAIKAWLEALEY